MGDLHRRGWTTVDSTFVSEVNARSQLAHEGGGNQRFRSFLPDSDRPQHYHLLQGFRLSDELRVSSESVSHSRGLHSVRLGNAGAALPSSGSPRNRQLLLQVQSSALLHSFISPVTEHQWIPGTMRRDKMLKTERRILLILNIICAKFLSSQHLIPQWLGLTGHLKMTLFVHCV